MENQLLLKAVTAADHLVGNLLFDFGALAFIAPKLHPDDIPEGEARTVYREMLTLYSQQRLSAGALEARLKAMGFDFRSYFTDLGGRVGIDDAPVLDEHVKELVNWSEVQTIKRQAMQVMAKADDVDARADELYPLLTAVPQGRATTGLRDISEYSSELLEDVDRWERGEAIEGLSTGFVALDNYFRLEPAKKYVIAGRPSMGKTSLGMEIVTNVADDLQKSGTPGCCAVFSAEMSGKSLVMRMAASLARVNALRIKRRIADAKEYQKYREAIQYIRQLPIKIDESPSPSPSSMIYQLAMMNTISPVRLLLFDFMELGCPDGKDERRIQNEEQRVSEIAKGLKNVAKRMNIPVIALSQLSRKVEERSDKLPTLADLRYSGMIEQVADGIIFVMRPEYYVKRNQSCYLDPNAGVVDDPENHPDAQGVAYVSVAKDRDGNVGMAKLAFMEHYTKFADLERTELNNY